ncbi:MAG TPA: DNA recombination/repair protein RecA, partial [Acidobacteriota bacterium]|nr:DNA recombination/repair protein RecA [Acidobacteriota bacterium]
SYGDERLGQGRENCKEFLRNNEKIAQEIEGKLRQEMGIQKPEPAAAAAE